MHNISGSSVDTTTSVATSASNGSNAPVVAGGFKIEPRDRAPPIRFVPPKHNLAAQSVVASAPSGFAKAPPLKIPFQPINRLAATGSAFPSSSLSLNLNQQHTPGQPQQASALKRKPEADPEALPTKRGRFVDENVIPLSTAAAPSPAGTPSTTLRESGSASERPTSAQARSNSAATRCVKRSRLVEPSSDEVVEVEAPLPKSRKSAESTGDGGGNAPRSKAKSVLDADEDDDGDSENGLEPSTSKPKVAVPKKAKSSTKKTKAVGTLALLNFRDFSLLMTQSTENNMSIKMGFQNAKKLEHGVFDWFRTSLMLLTCGERSHQVSPSRPSRRRCCWRYAPFRGGDACVRCDTCSLFHSQTFQSSTTSLRTGQSSSSKRHLRTRPTLLRLESSSQDAGSTYVRWRQCRTVYSGQPHDT